MFRFPGFKVNIVVLLLTVQANVCADSPRDFFIHLIHYTIYTIHCMTFELLPKKKGCYAYSINRFINHFICTNIPYQDLVEHTVVLNWPF